MAAATRVKPPGDDALRGVQPVNEVRLAGRLSGEPMVRELPSGDQLTTWRLVVVRARTQPQAAGQRAPTVDTIDCVAHKRAIQRLAERWSPGEQLEIRGALRRRFWHGAQGAASRYEVEVTEVTKVKSG
jgi:single-strand DNA-binding protein